MKQESSPKTISVDRASKRSLFSIFASVSLIIVAIYFGVIFQETGNITTLSYSGMKVAGVIFGCLAIVGIAAYVISEIFPYLGNAVQYAIAEIGPALVAATVKRISSESITYESVTQTSNHKTAREISRICILCSMFTTGIGLWFSIVSPSKSIWMALVFLAFIIALPLALIKAWALLWNRLVQFSKLATPFQKFKAGLSLCLFLTSLLVFTWCVSTTTSVVGLGGGITNQTHYVNALVKLEETLRQTFEFKRQEQEVIKESNEQKEYWRVEAVRADKGDHTGADGKGTLFRFLDAVEKRHSVIEETKIHDLDIQEREMSKRIRDAWMQIKRTPSKHFRGDHQGYKEAIDDLCKDVNQLSESTALKKIGRMAKKMTEVNKKTAFREGTSKSLIEKQKGKMDEYMGQLALFKKSLEESLAHVNSQKPEEVFFETMTPLNRIVVYRENILIWWGFALFFDTLPALVFMFLMGARHKDDEFIPDPTPKAELSLVEAP